MLTSSIPFPHLPPPPLLLPLPLLSPPQPQPQPLQSSLTPTLLAHLLPQIHAAKNTPKPLEMILLKPCWKVRSTQKGARRGRGRVLAMRTTLLIGV